MMRKSDVQLSYHQGNRHRPMVNVKHHLYIPELIARYQPADAGHEFSGPEHAGFWRWLESTYDDSATDLLDGPDEFAREQCWEEAQDLADETWPDRSVKVWSEGRSGGWCVVDGLPDVEDWDAIQLSRWARFQKAVSLIAHEEYPYLFVWHAYVNVWESHILPERAGRYPAPQYTSV